MQASNVRSASPDQVYEINRQVNEYLNNITEDRPSSTSFIPSTSSDRVAQTQTQNNDDNTSHSGSAEDPNQASDHLGAFEKCLKDTMKACGMYCTALKDESENPSNQIKRYKFIKLASNTCTESAGDCVSMSEGKAEEIMKSQFDTAKNPYDKLRLQWGIPLPEFTRFLARSVGSYSTDPIPTKSYIVHGLADERTRVKELVDSMKALMKEYGAKAIAKDWERCNEEFDLTFGRTLHCLTEKADVLDWRSLFAQAVRDSLLGSSSSSSQVRI
ncbi:hypothetical protein I302_104791 [Kwoniella bestiolae CBS 10118]|uniref:Uncharacterized protein n=1 Tax=Kwoniella bestiolae CBS 10118 TaxID=1296100 RepID=A0A1B9FRS3_9TREE|nr:hypothetical protein I302_09140 [Kwoniella bestiolae CBS 10118]OCF21461.1 hypothetical protein I302_09140 [Kwoniella bestiolae CBS 10118]